MRIFIVLFLFLTSCYRASVHIEPVLPPAIHPKEIFRETRVPLLLPEEFSLAPFPKLLPEEEIMDWGKEYKIGLVFADDFDLYRAITSFKRALVLLPCHLKERRREIEYCIALSYYLGKKYGEVVYEVESTDLMAIDDQFPAFFDVLVILYDSYNKLGRCKERDHILSLIEKRDSCLGEKLHLYQEISSADFSQLAEKKNGSLNELLSLYRREAKSVRRAEALNMICPGLGYWYVGQKQTAITAFLINGLFIGASVAFFENNNIPAGIITLSLESGWYLGGIYGAGLAAKYYNEKVYEQNFSRFCAKEKIYPLMLLRYCF